MNVTKTPTEIRIMPVKEFTDLISDDNSENSSSNKPLTEGFYMKPGVKVSAESMTRKEYYRDIRQMVTPNNVDGDAEGYFVTYDFIEEDVKSSGIKGYCTWLNKDIFDNMYTQTKK